MTRVELLLCKLIPYYFLGMLAMLLCMLVSVFILGVPYRGSLVILFIITSLFLLSTLGMGLLISTITRNQFNAAQVALNAAFLPSIMLSGFIFQIDSMPAVIRAVTYIIPARYFVSTLQSLFLAGNIPVVLGVNVLFLIASAVMFIGLTWLKNQTDGWINSGARILPGGAMLTGPTGHVGRVSVAPPDMRKVLCFIAYGR
ncbi:ABC transport system permease component YbhS [Salmonella enterica subsp. enterica]|uniref:Transport permease protein n=1 Tax=Salmonella enterica I TaxID=59201 RepID=A0A447U6Y9_SALET|nr:ABC transport system permease component YbhS [Salmonella enterica subsp. enterica]